MRELIAELLRVIDRGLPCVYCAVVATRGSTPQKAGSAMLVFADGSQTGTLGGGCVEAEVKKQALAALNQSERRATLHSFQLDDDYGWDDGLICGGRMTILTDPLSSAARPYYAALHDLMESGRGFSEVIELKGEKAGGRSLFDPADELIAAFGGPATRPSACEGYAVIPTRARICLLVVGAGHVGRAVAKLAAEVDFNVWVLDDRDSCVSEDRFPLAERRITGDIGRTLQSMKADITPATFALIVTRGHNHDEEALYHLATTPAGYIGMIGSKRKVRLIFDDLRAKGVSDDALARVHAPVGIEIHSQTVAEIAVSIVAELIAVRNRPSKKD